MDRKQFIYIPAAVVIGAGLYFVMNMEPIWWLAWFLPGLLFALALRAEVWTARGLVALAALIGASSNLAYFLKVMPLLQVLIILLLQSLMWVLILGSARRIVKAYEAAWTVLALPVVAVAVDTLLANLTPDGNFGSLAYTQSDVLPVAQFASVFGVGGIVFLVMLVNSALALRAHLRHETARLERDVRRHRARDRARRGFRLVALAARARRVVGVVRHRLGGRLHRLADLREVA